jgi:hypothetical protein
MPRTATTADANKPLPASWGAGAPECQHAASQPAQPSASASAFVEEHCTVSINAAHFVRKSDGTLAHWNILSDLGISGASVVYGAPGLLANAAIATPNSGPHDAASLEYDFSTTSSGAASLSLHLLPTFPVDSDHKLRYAIVLDGGASMERDMSGNSASKAAAAGDGPSGADWPQNVLRNSAIDTVPLGSLAPGKHTLRLLYRDPGVVFEHIVLTFPGAPPAYPVPQETVLQDQ